MVREYVNQLLRLEDTSALFTNMSGKLRWAVVAIIVLLLHLATVQTAQAQVVPEWEWQNPLPQGNNLRDVWANSSSDVFTVGDFGTIVHFDGTSWSTMPSGTTNTLNSIWGSSGSDVYAVGANGTIVHYDGTSWSPMASGTGSYLNGVWGSSSSDVFVVGDGDTILHYDGTSWNATPSGTTNNFYGVGGSGGSDVFAVGMNGTILHYDGTNWTAMTSGTTNLLYGVWGSSAGDVFVVGASGTILHYDGTSWSAMSSGTTTYPLYAVWASSSNDVFAVGQGGTILHYDGTDWIAMSSFTGTTLSGVGGSSAGDVFAVGQSDGMILYYDGTSWSRMSSGATTYPLYAVWASSSNDVFVVGQSGMIVHYNGAAWNVMPSYTGAQLYGVWGSSSSDVFAVGRSGMIVHYNGTSWSPMSSGTGAQLNDVWGSSSNDVFAVGQGGTILHYNGANWIQMPSNTGAQLYGVWGSSSSDVFAVGQGGTIVHYNGANWIQMPSNTGAQLNGVWGSDSSDIFAVGQSGASVHYNGANWIPMTSGTSSFLYGIWGSSSSDVFAVGQNGTIVHYDGSGWFPMISGTATYLNGVGGTSSVDVFAVGQGGTILALQTQTPELSVADALVDTTVSVVVPVNLTTNTSPVSAVAFTFDYDETCLTFDPVDDDSNGIPDNVSLQVNPSDFQLGADTALQGPGKIRVVVSPQNNDPLPLLGDETLVDLTFDVPTTPCTTSAVIFTNLSAGDNQGQSEAITSQGGTLTFNRPPVANDDDISLDEDSSTTGNVLVDNGHGADNDPDGDTITVVTLDGLGGDVGTQVTLSSGALLTLNSDGSFTYDPNDQFESLSQVQSAVDSFSYEISDGNLNDPGTVNLTIQGVNDAPVANLDLTPSPPLNVGDSVTADASTSYDPDDGDSIVSYTFDWGDGSPTVSSANSTETHAYAYPGLYTLTLTVEDGYGATGTATAQVLVAGARGDCNGDNVLDAGDLPAWVLEYFDGDDNNDWLSVIEVNPTTQVFAGNPVGCDTNEDTLINVPDLLCTIKKLLVGETAACSVVAAADAGGTASLRLPEQVKGAVGEQVALPVTLASGGEGIAAAVFSLDLTGLKFDPQDADGDGVPDAIQVADESVQVAAAYDAADATGELDVALYSPLLSALADGVLVTVTVDVTAEAPTVQFSAVTPASLGTIDGQSVSVETSPLAPNQYHFFLPALTR